MNFKIKQAQRKQEKARATLFEAMETLAKANESLGDEIASIATKQLKLEEAKTKAVDMVFDNEKILETLDEMLMDGEM